MAKASKVSTWFLWFVLYSLIGWAYETALCSIEMGQWDNRGFLYGPICPIYGAVATLSLALLYKRIKNVALLFLTGVVLTTGVEYVTSVSLELAFGLRWWDYSHFRFNIAGRISLLGAVVFGVLIVLLIKVIHPRIESLTERLPDKVKIILASTLAGMIVLDFCLTIIHLLAVQ